MAVSGKKVVAITDIFPPVNSVGVHRTVSLCRHLVQRGCGVTVISTRPREDVLLDKSLLATVPKEVRVVRTLAPDLPKLASRILRGCSYASEAPTKAVTEASARRTPGRLGRWRRAIDWFSWWLHVPDSSVGWLFPAVWAGICEAGRHRPDVIFSSAPMWTCHLTAAVLSRFLRVPWVADFRDPWCGSAWHQVPYKLQRCVDGWMERIVVRGASRITCAWDGIRRHLIKQYPDKEQAIETVLNGFDEQQIASVSAVRVDNAHCVLLHAGTLYGPRSPVPLLLGLRRFHQETPTEAERLLVVLLGCPTYAGRALPALARDYGIEDLVRVMPSTTHRKALSYLKGADVAVLFGQSGREDLASVPSKAYEYIGAGKPILAVGAGEEVLKIMRRGGCQVWDASETGCDCARVLREIVAAYEANKLRDCRNERLRSTFTRQRMARRLASVLEEVANCSFRERRRHGPGRDLAKH